MTAPRDADKRVDHVLGAHGAAALVNAWITALMLDDHLPRPVATRIACERVADLSPWLIAAPGQTWRLREEFEPTSDFTPELIRIVAARRPHGLDARAGQAGVLMADAEHDPRGTVGGWLDMDDFAIFYALEDWPHPRVRHIRDDGIVIAVSQRRPTTDADGDGDGDGDG
ncbi:hypothetical protein ACIRL2_45845 [Embleya sp. NPDC127516]|uniref:hypothetical protein n=1 Tax=Embleya sp. NPDC127516 TaxID=3363990 RepID=UPI00381DBB94